MSGVEQTEQSRQRWLMQAGVKNLWAWQQDALKAWEAGHSWIGTFPMSGGRGLLALLTAQLPGRTWLVCHDPQRLERRAQQARELGVSFGICKDLTSPCDAPLQLVHTSLLAAQADPGIPLAEQDRILLDAPLTEKQPPAWWATLPATQARAIMVDHRASTGWWCDPDHRQGLQVLVPTSAWTQDLGQYQLHETKAPPPSWRQEHPAELTWWIGASAAQLDQDAFIVPADATQRHTASAQLSSPTQNTWSLERCEIAPPQLPAPTHIYFDTQPSHFHDLALAALRGQEIWLHTPDTQAQDAPLASHDTSNELSAYLSQMGKEAPQGIVYLSSSELLSALNQPITPQPAFERGAQQLHRSLEALLQQGALSALETVHFQVKIHSAQRFKEPAVKDDPQLLRFWQAYERMQQELSTMDSLKLSLFNGRTIDLRELSQHMPYSVAELNQMLQALIDKGILIASLEHVFAPERSDREYLLQLGRPQTSSLGVRLWLRCAQHQQDLLDVVTGRSPLSDEFVATWQQFVAHPPEAPEHWEALHALVGPNADQTQLVQSAGMALVLLDHDVSQHGLLVWLCAHHRLGLVALDKATLRQAFPPPKQAPDAAKATLQWLLEVDRDNFKHYVLDLKDPSDFAETIEAYLQEEAEGLLQRNTSHRARGVLHRYTRLAKIWSQAHPESTPTWTAAAGWAAHLQGQKQPAISWIEQLLADPKAQPTLVQWRLLQIAITAKQWHTALAILDTKPADCPLDEQQLETLQRELFSGLHQLCRKHPKDEACPNIGTSFCPNDANALLALNGQRPHLPQEHLQHCIASRLQHDLGDSDSVWLRKILDEGPGQETRRIQRLILSKLAERNEATPAELEQLASWHERAGRREEAFPIRQQLLAAQPDNGLNLQRLAIMAANDNQLEQSLRWALEANRTDPQRFPLERFVERNRERYFADPKALREMLIELPAHPAFRALEDELEKLDKLYQQLAPLQQKAEQAIQEKRFGQAKEIIKPLLREHKHHLPPVFEELKAQIVAIEADLLQRIAQIPHRDHKKRNQHLEEVATEAIAYGMQDIADEAYQKLVKLNPQYGLGFLKLARTATDPAQRKEAYQKAVDLSKTPQQRQRNLAEYIGSLEEEGKAREILPLLVEIADSFPDEVPQVVAPLMIKLVENLGADPEITKDVKHFLDTVNDPKPFKQVKQALGQMDEMEPWKRALLSIKPN